MKRTWKVADPTLFLMAVLITALGMLFIFDAGYPRAIQTNKGMLPPEFLAQIKFLPLAILAGFLAARVNPSKWQQWSKPIWVLSMLSLVGVKVIGHTLNGAQRWIDIGPLSIQPSEFCKLATVIYLAGVFAERKSWPAEIKPRKNFAHWMDTVFSPKLVRALPAMWVLIAVLLIEKEPDLGTGAVIAVTAFVMMFVGGVSRKSLIASVVIAAVGVGFMVKSEPYRLERILNHNQRWSADNVDDTGFQTVQSELGMATGGVTGTGIGNGRTKHILPATTTDFILATIAEETGLAGSFAVLALIGGIVFRLLHLSKSAPTNFGRILMLGTASWIGIQSCVNVMMANGLLPAIGIPLPFVSSGGSSLMALWLAVGVCQSVMRPELVAVEGGVEEKTNARRRHWRWNRRSRLSRA